MKNLVTADGFISSPEIERTLPLLDPYFEGELSFVTSGFRTAQKQLAIIVEKVAMRKLAHEYWEYAQMLGSEHFVHVIVDGENLYWWQRAWSKLLNIGDIVNPPVPAEVLFDYFRPGSTENKKGLIIPMSTHQRGLALDIGGGQNLQEKAKRVLHAEQQGKCFIKNFLIERINNAVHVDLEPL